MPVAIAIVRGALLLLHKEETVFEDSLFASTARPNPRRGWTAAISFGFQALVLGVLVLLPMVFTDALPVSALKGAFIVTAPVRSAALPRPPEVHRSRPSPSDMENGVAIAPIRIPDRIAIVHDEQPLSGGGGDPGPYIPGAIPDSAAAHGNAISILLHATPQPVQPHNVAPKSVRLSIGVTEGLLIHKITPMYPQLARHAGIQGQVLLQATIGRDGSVQNLQVVSGHPMLVGAAIDAVKQWRYRPYLLNNEPVEVDTQITVNFRLGG